MDSRKTWLANNSEKKRGMRKERKRSKYFHNNKDLHATWQIVGKKRAQKARYNYWCLEKTSAEVFGKRSTGGKGGGGLTKKYEKRT